MILSHAITLASEKVVRNGVEFTKAGPFTDEQLKADDWEPVRAPYVQPTSPEDCGCGQDSGDDE